MKTLEQYEAQFRNALPAACFLRLSRTRGLFVTDAPRFGIEISKPDGAEAEIENGLMYLTPDFSEVPAGAKAIFPQIYKEKGVSARRLLHRQMALCMRNKDSKSVLFLKELEQMF